MHRFLVDSDLRNFDFSVYIQFYSIRADPVRQESRYERYPKILPGLILSAEQLWLSMNENNEIVE